jgi:magnesium transporter
LSTQSRHNPHFAWLDDVIMDLKELVRAVRARVPLDAAMLLAQEPAERVEAVLKALPPDFAARVAAQLPGARADGAEAAVPGLTRELMEPVRGVFGPEATVAEAVDSLRHADNVGDITYLYVVRGVGKLLGLVVMRDLLLAAPDARLDSIMLPTPFSLSPEMSVGDAVKAAVKRHYPVYPVCDASGELVGIVRGWKLFERQAVEITAQSGQMVGVGKEERVYSSLWTAFRMRHPWLQINLLTAFLAGFVVSLFEGTISQIVALAAFLPILAGQSGNTGCQALAITLRGMTLGDTDGYPIRKLVLKEVTLGAMNGLLTGLVAGAAMWWTAARSGNEQAPLLGLVIVLAMTGSCMASGFFGVMVPAVLRRYGADPATASSIFLTTGTDIAGMGLMLTLATTMVL